MSETKTFISVQVKINAPLEKVWKYFTEPNHITGWNFAIPEWSCPKAEVDLHNGGKFNYRMEARDGSFGFDFTGIISHVEIMKKIVCTLDDGREWETVFLTDGNSTLITEYFEPENQNPVEMQKEGWQSILNNFKKYSENI